MKLEKIYLEKTRTVDLTRWVKNKVTAGLLFDVSGMSQDEMEADIKEAHDDINILLERLEDDEIKTFRKRGGGS